MSTILETGAILRRDLSRGDFVCGQKYGVKIWLSTFNPCQECMTAKACRSNSYKKCDDAYLKLWMEAYA